LLTERATSDPDVIDDESDEDGDDGFLAFAPGLFSRLKGSGVDEADVEVDFFG